MTHQPPDVDKSWTLAGGPGNPLYELYDRLRRGLNHRLTNWLLGHALQDDEAGLVIEAGSGTGFASALVGEHPRVALSIAVDYDLDALREGAQNRPDLVAVVADVHRLPFKKDCATLVWNSSTIEHLPDQARVVQEMARVAAGGGFVFVGVPSKRGPLFFQQWIAETGVGVWLGTVFKRADVENWLRTAGCGRVVAAMHYFLRFFIGVIAQKDASPPTT